MNTLNKISFKCECQLHISLFIQFFWFCKQSTSKAFNILPSLLANSHLQFNDICCVFTGYLLGFEVLNLCQLNDKVDVYSFGILLLETIISEKNSEFTLSTNKNYLLEWVNAIFFSLCTFIRCLQYHGSHNKLEMFTYKCVNRSYAINIPS
jgi:hypothetical protein